MGEEEEASRDPARIDTGATGESCFRVRNKPAPFLWRNDRKPAGVVPEDFGFGTKASAEDEGACRRGGREGKCIGSPRSSSSCCSRIMEN